MQKKIIAKISFLLLLFPALLFAQDQDVNVIPDNTRFDSRIVVERRVDDPLAQSISRGRIYFDDILKVYKGDIGSGIVTFSTSNAGAHNILSATHNDVAVAVAQNGDILRYLGGSGKWTRFAIGSANALLSVNSLGTDWSYRTLSGTANQVIITPSGSDYVFSLPQSIATGSSPTFSALTITNAVNAGSVVSSGAVSGTTITGSGVVQGTQLTSTIATGTAPLVVTSTTLVANLNAALLNGQADTFYRNATNLNAGLVAATRGGLNKDVSASAAGGLFYLSAIGIPDVLPIGTDGKWLQAVAGLPSWQTLSVFYQTIQANGSDLTQRNKFNVIANSNQSAADNGGTSVTDIKTNYGYYTIATTANISNTTTQTTVCSFTIKANDLELNGEKHSVIVDLAFTVLNATGSNRTFDFDISTPIGGLYSDTTGNIGSNGNSRSGYVRLILMSSSASGGNLKLTNGAMYLGAPSDNTHGFAGALDAVDLISSHFSSGAATAGAVSSDRTVSIKVTLSTNSVNYTWNVRDCLISFI